VPPDVFEFGLDLAAHNGVNVNPSITEATIDLKLLPRGDCLGPRTSLL
jgi:hypothetical protein